MKIIDVNSWNTILDKMVIIGGSARSGTTIMGKLINSLENVEYYFEPPMLTSILLKENELNIDSIKELLQFYFYDNFLLDCLAGRNINLNKNDDSCILNVKSKEDIEARYNKSFTRVELEDVVNKSTFAFKLPEIVFFLDFINKLYPQNKAILMHRAPNDVINSIVRKKWFSDEWLSEKHSSQVYAVKIVDSIKVPYWIKEKDEKFWIESSEIDRCAYYYMRISEEILRHASKNIIVDYDKFIKEPQTIFKLLTQKLNLDKTDKTDEILQSVKFQEKKRENFLTGLDSTLLSNINILDLELKELAIK